MGEYAQVINVWMERVRCLAFSCDGIASLQALARTLARGGAHVKSKGGLSVEAMVKNR